MTGDLGDREYFSPGWHTGVRDGTRAKELRDRGTDSVSTTARTLRK